MVASQKECKAHVNRDEIQLAATAEIVDRFLDECCSSKEFQALLSSQGDS